MTLLKTTIETALPLEAAFDYIAAWESQAEWDPNTVSSARIGNGAPEVGARYALEVKMGPSTKSMEYRITELERPSRLVLVGEGSGIWTEDILTFTETGNGTRIDYQAEIKLHGWLGWIQPLLGRAFDGITKGVEEGMKRELDARSRR